MRVEDGGPQGRFVGGFEHKRRAALPFAMQMQPVLAYRHEMTRSGPLLDWWGVDPGQHMCS
jgi:hypothetical protein